MENVVRGVYAPRQPRHKVCVFWQEGRCNRHPCRFLHSDLSSAPDPSNSKQAHNHDSRNMVWRRNPSTGGHRSGSNGFNQPTSTGELSGSMVTAGGYGGGPDGGNQSTNTNDFNGNSLVTTRSDGLCKNFLGRRFSLHTTLEGHEKVITAIALPPGSDKLYSGSKDNTIKQWDGHTGQVAWQLENSYSL